MASFRTAAVGSISHHPIFFILFTGVVASIVFSAWSRTRKPRLFPGAPYTGLANGARSLAEARRRYQTHAAEMLLEGYKKVGLNLSRTGLSLVIAAF